MLQKRLKEYSALVEAGLDRLFPQEDCRHSRIFEACRYSLLAGGKHIRAALLLEFYRLCGGKVEDALAFACGLEMIHTYSLVHDDLPCMDNDDFRRGKPSNHKVYGETMATLAGDALLNRAFEVMLEQETVPAACAMKAAACISRCSGVYGMIGGQVMDMLGEKTPLTKEKLYKMNRLKTGCLIKCACLFGLYAAENTTDVPEKLFEDAVKYADGIGVSFQITDDILDVCGDEKTFGKPIGSDAENGKTTFTTIYTVDEARNIAKGLTDGAIDSIKNYSNSEKLISLAEFLLSRQS